MAKKQCKCNRCNKSFLKNTGELNRSIKNGSPIYCGRECVGLQRQMNLENITHRFCNYCNKLLTVDNFNVKNKNGRKHVVARCKKCYYTTNKIGLDLENRKATERKRLSTPTAKDKKNKFQREWRKQNITKNRKYHSKHIKKHVDEITDSYVIRNFFRGLKNISPETIEAQRQIIKVKRLIKLKNKTQ